MNEHKIHIIYVTNGILHIPRNFNQNLTTIRQLTGNVRQKDEVMKIGYVRVSKQEQHEALQIDALQRSRL